MRIILLAIVAGVLCGILILTTQKMGYDSAKLMPLLVIAAVVLATNLSNRLWPPKPMISPPDPDHLHWHYLGMAGVGASMVGSLFLLRISPSQSSVWGGILIASLAIGLWYAVRQNALRLAYKQDPALFDERAQANQRKSEKWAFLATLETALILGLIDFQNIIDLSGAFVGICAGVAGILTGLLVQAWLEWRDSR